MRLALEVFAGAAGLSAALTAVGIACGPPMEAYPHGQDGKAQYNAVHDFDCGDVFDRLVREILSGPIGI